MNCNLELESCVDAYNLGLRSNGVYKVKENNQIVDKQCNLESCVDAYNLGFQDNGMYKVNINGQIQDEECIFDKANCKSWYDAGYRQTGNYIIAFPTSGPKQVRCNMEHNGGGWIVIQRRFNGNVDFYREWEAYKEGFGTLDDEFWLGNKYLHELTGTTRHIWYFKATTFLNEEGTSEYHSFQVDSEDNNYHARGGKLTGLRSLPVNYGFSTPLRDNDGRDPVNCAAKNKAGGFWYSTCGAFNPNGEYLQPDQMGYQKGIYWHAFKGYSTSMKTTEMMIREQ